MLYLNHMTLLPIAGDEFEVLVDDEEEDDEADALESGGMADEDL